MSNNQGLLFNLSPASGHFSIVKFPFLNSFVSESPLNLYKEGIFLWLATDRDAGVWLARGAGQEFDQSLQAGSSLCIDPPVMISSTICNVFSRHIVRRKEGRLYNSSSDLFVSILDKDLSCHSPGLRLRLQSTIAVYVLIRTQGIRGAPGWLCAISDANLIQQMTATRNFSGLAREFYFGEKRGNKTRPSALT